MMGTSTSSLDIVVGGSWKVDARYVTHLYAYRGEDERFDYTPILDIIDIVVDGANITSRLPEESIFCVMQELVTGLSMICERRVDKHIVTFPEAGWELAIQRADEGFELSFYGAERHRQVSLHNVRVGRERLLNTVCYATERLLDDLVEVNDAFAREGTVRDLEWQLARLRAHRNEQAGPATRIDVPREAGRVELATGDRRLGLSLAFDASHADFWRYQGALVSDLHSLLFSGTLTLTYWGKRRSLGTSTYLFPLLEGLVAGAERLLQLLERRAGGCVILDGSDGSESLLTAEVLDADRLLLRVTEPNGSVGRTRATPEQVFSVFLDTAQQFLGTIVELNPRQVLNHRVHDLRVAVDRLRGQFFDIRRGDVYFDAVQRYLREVPAIEPLEGEVHRPVGRMPYPIDQLRHVFLRSAWYLARNHIRFREITAVGGDLLVPSEGRVECLDRRDGGSRWSVPSTGLLGVTTDLALAQNAGGFSMIELATGETSGRWTVDSTPSAAILLNLGQTTAAILQASETTLMAVDLGARKTLWTQRLEHGEIVGATLAGPVVAVVTDDGFAYGLRPSTGQYLWKVRVPGTCVIPPAYHEGRLYLCADTDIGIEGVLYSIYPLTGRRVYVRRAAASFSRPPLFVGGVGLFALETPTHAVVAALDLEEGRILWTQAVENAQVDTPVLFWVPRGSGGTLVIKSDTGQCRGVQLRTGNLKWATNLLDAGDILLSNLEPALIDDHLVVAERYTSILDPFTGHRLHRFVDLPEHPCFLHVDDNLRLIIGEGDDHLECFDLSGFLALVRD